MRARFLPFFQVDIAVLVGLLLFDWTLPRLISLLSVLPICLLTGSSLGFSLLIGTSRRRAVPWGLHRVHQSIAANEQPRLSMSVLVLVVDDEPDVEALFRQQFRRDLRSQRFVMDFAISATDALTRISGAVEQSLILILSDINMPGMTGLEMLPKAKALRPDVPIIMITAYGDPETKRKAIEGGAEGLLTKPIDFTLLREEIDTRLERAS